MFESKTLSIAARRQTRGFTLVELLVTMGLLGILAALAAPSFADFMRQQRVKSMRDEMMASIAHARVEAITRGHSVVLLRTTPCPQAVSPLDWDCGWAAFADLNGNGALDANETVLHEVQGRPGTRIRRSPAASFHTIKRMGNSTFGRFEIFPAGSAFSPVNGVLLCLSKGGRVRSARDAADCH
ncbi:MAG: GspH/FimT family pseudopilin [Hydrogenophaga sp.]|uniref:GspH/FimT family pseudopilin n=1 Tax=Hydrogenophaga sp. TaxID=1904254 RepID=UPI002605D433|nr:GspH/FimT family pseudopilin [Hydrogenophaga sp.]MDM7942479.1 GspH/FimT family pseudopilin [Hydrogenophaga sp.]